MAPAPLKCPTCGQPFKDPIARNQHQEAKHGKPQTAVGRAMRRKQKAVPNG